MPKKIVEDEVKEESKLILKLDSGIYNVDLEKYKQYVDFHPTFAQYFPMQVGQNHHKLLSYLASQLRDGSIVGDIGTLHGQSAVALASNEKLRVITIDSIDQIPTDPNTKTIRDIENIEIIVGNCFSYLAKFISCELICFDITPHNGTDEKKFLDLLVHYGYRGIVVFDDIHLDTAMTTFWNEITLKKFDATPYGHYSGSGIVVFNPQHIDLEVNF